MVSQARVGLVWLEMQLWLHGGVLQVPTDTCVDAAGTDVRQASMCKRCCHMNKRILELTKQPGSGAN